MEIQKHLAFIKSLLVPGIAFIIILYSSMIEILMLVGLFVTYTHERAAFKATLIVLISAVIASYVYLKQFPEESDVYRALEKIVFPFGQVKPYYVPVAVCSLFTTFAVHIMALFQKSSFISLIVEQNSQAYGFLLIVVLCLIGVSLLVVSFVSAVSKKINFTHNKKQLASVLVMLYVVIFATVGYFLFGILERYQEPIAAIGLFVIGSIPLTILTILTAPEKYLYKET